MNQWLFVGAAYGVTLGAAAALVAWSWLAVRAAERDGR